MEFQIGFQHDFVWYQYGLKAHFFHLVREDFLCVVDGLIDFLQFLVMFVGLLLLVGGLADVLVVGGLLSKQLLGAIFNGFIDDLVEIVAVDVVGDIGFSLARDKVGVVSWFFLCHGVDGHCLAFCEPDGYRLF